MTGKLILASASPRRQELLRNAGIAFVTCPANIPEIPRPGEDAVGYVRRLAAGKARAVAGDLVLAADTTVELDGHLLEKPADSAEALRMIAALSGRRHLVHTGICLRMPGREIIDHATTAVVFREIPPSERQWYVDSGEPMGKAGGYGIQGLASRFVDRVEGCYFNVVGLPVSLVWNHLRTFRAQPGNE
jgi:septum formation protein